MNFGAIIVAAGLSSRMNTFKPMLELSGSTIIKQSITTFNLCKISPIVVVTGHNSEKLIKHLKNEHVTTIYNKDYNVTDMLYSAKLGMREISGKCDAFFFLPADIPLFSIETIKKLIEYAKANSFDVLSPVFMQKKGHPILINSTCATSLINYLGADGLRGALLNSSLKKTELNVDDIGITLDADYPEDYTALQKYAIKKTQTHDISISIDISFKRKYKFWDAKTYLLLEKIFLNSSLNKSCEDLGISYTTGWKMIKIAEYNIGFQLIERRQGGENGGGSTLTPSGLDFLKAYRNFIKLSDDYIHNAFKNTMQDFF